MKIAHKITIGFIVPSLLAGLLSHIYMAKCQETGREQERILFSAIASPIRDMATAAQRLRERHRGIMVPVSANDELGYLAEAFNSMSAGLKEREAQMKLSNRELHEALLNIKTLRGLLPICASCKKHPRRRRLLA